MLNTLKNFKVYFYILLIALGLIMTVISVFGFFFTESTPDFIKGAVSAVGNWKYWLIVIGPVLVIADIWYVYVHIRDKKRFLEIIESDSRSKFKKNLKELETLAYTLGKKYQRMLGEKKKMWKIKH